jgi:peptidyl-prolyl cis-trans isomerase B (cyclophilin B)
VHRILIAALASLILVGAGCGGGDKKADATPAPPDRNGCETVPQPTSKDTKLTAPTAELDPAKTYVATVKTNCGDFQITLDAKRAPKTAASFKSMADQKFYDGTIFHRIVPGFVMQGGDPLGNGAGGPGYSVEEKPPEALEYEKGVVAMAKSQEEPAGTSGSQFFVVTGPDAAQLPPDYALLGNITGGQAVVDKIGAIITDPRTDRPDDPVLIRSIRVTES